MNTASARNAIVTTPRIWNWRTTGSRPMIGSRGGGAALLAVRNCSMTDMDASGSNPSGDVMFMRTCVVGASKSVFSAVRVSPKSFVILSAMLLPPLLIGYLRASRFPGGCPLGRRRSRCHLQERGIAGEQREVELLPRRARRVILRSGELREIAQPQHPLDDDAGALLAATSGEEDETREAVGRQ